MNENRYDRGPAGLMRALAAGFQWRLLLIWLALLLLPAMVATWPMNALLGSLLGNALPDGVAFDTWLGGDLFVQLGKSMSAISAAAAAGSLLAFLLAPFLTGMAVVSARERPGLGFGALMHGGLGEYWRMFRVWLWSLVGLAVAAGIGSGLLNAAGEHAKQAVLQADADWRRQFAMVVLVVLVVLAHAVAEAARAQFAADPALRSATRAYGRGLKLLVRRPLATLGRYLVVTILGLALVAAFVALRMRVPGGAAGPALAFLAGELIVLGLAWMRIARIHALTLGMRR